MKLKLLTIQFIILFLLQNFLFAQETKSLSNKINSIEGDANKIVISTTKGEYVFENEDAEKMVKKLKRKEISKKIERIIKNHDEFSDNGEDVLIFSADSCDNYFIKEFSNDKRVMVFRDNDMDDIGIQDVKLIKINFEDSDDMVIDIDVDIDNEDHIVRLEKKTIECKNSKDIKVEIIDGRKKVEVKTFENGEEKVKVYEGDEAEKYLKNEQDNNKIKK